MNEHQNQYGVVHHTDPDLLLALSAVTQAIKELKTEPPNNPQLYGIEACDLPGEKKQPWWQTLIYLLLLVLCVVCIHYGLASLS